MKFFKFTLPKFFVAALLFAIFAAISPVLYRYIVLDSQLRGLPLPFAFMKDSCATGMEGCLADFFWYNFVLDLLFWYVISSVLFYLDKVIKRR